MVITGDPGEWGPQSTNIKLPEKSPGQNRQFLTGARLVGGTEITEAFMEEVGLEPQNPEV
jgi:hypothetical protein